MLCGVGSLGKVWAKTFGGIIVKNTIQEKTRIINQGAGDR